MEEVKDPEIIITALKAEWDNANTKRSWFKIDFSKIARLANFTIFAIDQTVQFLEPLLVPGESKKKIALAILLKVFDYAVAGVIPIWLKPFVYIIKKVVVAIICSSIIDHFVCKYKEGIWSQKPVL